MGCSLKTSATDIDRLSAVTTVRGVMISLTRTLSSERALAMMLDSLFESVPSWAPLSASRMISSSEPCTLAGGPTKGLTTSAQNHVTGERNRLSQPMG